MQILSWLASLGCVVCWVMVLIKMFPAEGPLKGILGIICGLYAFIWGWMNSTKQNLKTIMLIWTVAILVSVLAGGMGAYSAFSGATSGM
jgi:hypothetical protein